MGEVSEILAKMQDLVTRLNNVRKSDKMDIQDKALMENNILLAMKRKKAEYDRVGDGVIVKLTTTLGPFLMVNVDHSDAKLWFSDNFPGEEITHCENVPVKTFL